jgi:hypothetical protein
MNQYNDRWTKEKFLEYRRLKRSGYSHEMLKEHFGEDIYESGMYNRNGSSLPSILLYGNFINEIKISPEETDYDYIPRLSSFIKGKSDYIITFNSNNITYIICLMFFPINGIETYNVVFTTEDQWSEYNNRLREMRKKGTVTSSDFEILSKIIGRETNFNDLFPILRKLSWILLDFCSNHLKNINLSIGETDNEKKINLYRNIIKDSFPNFGETKVSQDGFNYYIY